MDTGKMCFYLPHAHQRHLLPIVWAWPSWERGEKNQKFCHLHFTSAGQPSETTIHGPHYGHTAPSHPGGKFP